MSVDIKRGSDVSMPHQILKSFRIHPRFCHVGTIRMVAYMRYSLRNLNLINGIILLHYMHKIMIPVKRIGNASILVVEQEPRVPVNKTPDETSSNHHPIYTP